MKRLLEKRDIEIVTPDTVSGLESFVEAAQGPIGFGKPEGVKMGNLKLTPTKPNSARVRVPVYWGEDKTGMDLWVICFGAGDGTGDLSTYGHGTVLVPEKLRSAERQEKVYPRSKDGVLLELGLPLSSVGICKGQDSADHHHRCTSNEEEASSFWLLGIDDVSGVDVVRPVAKTEPNGEAFVTVGPCSSGERVGDPHAVYYPGNTKSDILDHVATVGFLAATEEFQLSILGALPSYNPYV